MPLERIKRPLERLLRGGDDILTELGYKWLYFGSKGVAYEKLIGHTKNYSEPDFQIISIEKTDSGDYIFMGCKKEGLSGYGHKATWFTFDEIEAVYKKMKELKKASKRRKASKWQMAINYISDDNAEKD